MTMLIPAPTPTRTPTRTMGHWCTVTYTGILLWLSTSNNNINNNNNNNGPLVHSHIHWYPSVTVHLNNNNNNNNGPLVHSHIHWYPSVTVPSVTVHYIRYAVCNCMAESDGIIYLARIKQMSYSKLDMLPFLPPTGASNLFETLLTYLKWQLHSVCCL